jgi:hypothetical protein
LQLKKCKNLGTKNTVKLSELQNEKMGAITKKNVGTKYKLVGTKNIVKLSKLKMKIVGTKNSGKIVRT